MGAERNQETDGDGSLVLQLGEFALKSIAEESAQLGVSIKELAEFAVLYYLADLDSGRIARRIPSISPPASAPEGLSEPSRERHRD